MELFVSCSFDNKGVINFFLDLINVQPGVFAFTAELPEPVRPVEKITKYIESSDALLAILTKDKRMKDGSFLCSPYVQNEIGIAHSMKKRILAFKELGVEKIGIIPEVTEYVNFKREKIGESTSGVLHYLSQAKKFISSVTREDEIEEMKQKYRIILNDYYNFYLGRGISSIEFSRYSMLLKNNGIKEGIRIVRFSLIKSEEYSKSRKSYLTPEISEILKDTIKLIVEQGELDPIVSFLSKEENIDEDLLQRMPEEGSSEFSWRIVDLLNSSEEMHPKLINLIKFIDKSLIKIHNFIYLKKHLKSKGIAF